MKPIVVSAALLALVSSHALQAQRAPAGAAATAGDRLPVRRVVLYKSGVGYFEHLGRVRGSQNVTIDFTSGQLDDVLKSLTALDLDGGRVSGVSYNSEASLDRRLGSLRLPVGEQPTRAQFLTALRGARVDVRGGGNRVVGRLLGVERVPHKGDGAAVQIDAVSIVTDDGEIHTIPLDADVTVRIADNALNEEVGRYLGLLSTIRDRDLRRLTIATAGSGDRDLFVSYVSEVPVWKATYRLVLAGAPATGAAARPPLLQGWAIVDNTVGEDWENVELSLVAGAPQSFVQQISRPYYVQRPIVPLPRRALFAPQTHQSAVSTSGAGAIAGSVTDSNGGVLPGVTVTATRSGVLLGRVVTDATGRFRMPGIDPGSYEVRADLASFRPTTRTVVVSAGMESVTNIVLQSGTLTEEVTVSPRVAVVGGLASARASDAFKSRLTDKVEEVRLENQESADAGDLGDLFEYKVRQPITIRKNQSALVPILSSQVSAEKVSLWNGAAGVRPLRAVWLTNSTGLTLDGGTFSVVERDAFAGEGLIEPLKAGERRLLSYAVDLALTVDAKQGHLPTRIRRVRVARGLAIEESEERRVRTVIVRNEDVEERALVFEHPIEPGWELDGDLKPAETTPTVYRFRVPVPARTSATFTIDERRPLSSEIAIASVDDEKIALWIRERAANPAIEAQFRDLRTRQAAVARLDAEIAARRAELDEISRDQNRVRENMKSLRGSPGERQLLQRYVRQLDEQETRLTAVRTELVSLTGARQKAQQDLEAFIEAMIV